MSLDEIFKDEEFEDFNIHIKGDTLYMQVSFKEERFAISFVQKVIFKELKRSKKVKTMKIHYWYGEYDNIKQNRMLFNNQRPRKKSGRGQKGVQRNKNNK